MSKGLMSVVVVLVLIARGTVVHSQESTRLLTVPSVDSYEQRPGWFRVAGAPIFVDEDGGAPLRKFGRLIAAEFGLSGSAEVASAPAAGALFFTLDESMSGDEAYVVEIADALVVRARTSRGLFYASRTLLQLMRRADRIPRGVIRDEPDYAVRSLLLDVGRKFISKEGLMDWIRLMGWFKFNELHLHLNDNSWGRYAGYRLESKVFPGLASSDGHYTFADIRELQDFAAERGVTIVPEIDSPGHSLAFTNLRPELAHGGLYRDGLGFPYLDLNNPDVLPFIQKVWDEVCGLFDSEYVHIGTDEYRLNAIEDKAERARLGEKFRLYINHLNAYIRWKHGKKVRIWSGYEHMPGETEPSTNVVIDMWETSDAKNKVSAGYKVLNSSHFYTYIVPGAPYYGVNNRFLYERWTPRQFSNKAGGILEPEDPGLLGGKLHVWNDFGPSGYTWNEIVRLALPSMAAISEKLWGGAADSSYESFERDSAPLLKAVPGVSLTQRGAATGKKTVWELDEPLLLLPSSQRSLDLPAGDLEWPWTLELSLTRKTDVAGDEVLLSSDLAAVYTDLTWTVKEGKTEKTRRGFAIVRANQGFGHEPLLSHRPDILIFDYQVPVGTRTDITILGERGRTSLYVGGELVESIDKQTLCPIARLGHKLPKAPHALVHSMRVLNTVPQRIVIGHWKSGEIAETSVTRTWDVSNAIKGEGAIQVTFRYTGGLHRLDIEGVELLEDGRVVAADKHEGTTGGRHEKNTYLLNLDSRKSGARYSIRATVHCDGGRDSNGTVTLMSRPSVDR